MVTLEHFTEQEVEGLTDRLKIYLQALRYISNTPIYITSGLRQEDTTSEHSTGQGVDISDNPNGDPISSGWRHKISKALHGLQIARIGIYDRHIHFGVSRSHPQDVSWIGQSR